MPEVSSLLSSGNVPREKEGLPRPCFEGVVLVLSEAALLLLLLLDSESELLRGRLQSFRYTKKLFFTGWLPLLKPLAGKSIGGSSVDLSLSLSELELGRGLLPRLR